MAILYIYLSVGVRGGQHNHYALINQVIPPCDIMSEAHITASVQLTECMMRVWREDWCQHWTTICVTLPLLNHTNWCSVSVSPSSQTCQQTQRNPPPPLSSSPSWALPILCVSAWLNGGHISRLHSLWHCMGVNAGRVFLSDSCTLTVTLGSSISSPCYRWSLFWSSVLSLTQLLWLHLCLSGFVPRICT